MISDDDGDSTIRPGYSQLVVDSDKERDTAVCYTGGFAVKQVHQMCDVTSTLMIHRIESGVSANHIMQIARY